MATLQGTIQVTCTIRRDVATESYISHCPEFKLYSAGNTELEAQEAIKSAIMLFLHWAYERRKLGEFLQNLGMQFTPASEMAPTQFTDVTVGPLETQSIPIQVPFYLLQQAELAARGVA